MNKKFISLMWRSYGFYTSGHIILAPHDWHKPPPDDGDIDDVTYNFILAVNPFIKQYRLHSDIKKDG